MVASGQPSLGRPALRFRDERDALAVGVTASGTKLDPIEGRESRRLSLPAEFDTPTIREGLLRATSSMPHSVFSIDGRGLRIGNVVGFVEVGPVRVEILPKVSSASGRDEDVAFLMNLLATAGLMPRAVARRASVAVSRGPFVDAVIAGIASDLSEHLATSPPRRYWPVVERDARVIRGRLDLVTISQNSQTVSISLTFNSHPFSVTTRRVNSCARWYCILVDLARSSRTRAVLQAIERDLTEVQRRPLTPELISAAEPTPYEQEWRGLIALAKALLAGRSPIPVAAGDLPARGLIFSLHDLFEDALRLNLPTALATSGLDLGPRRRNLNLLTEIPSGNEVLQMKPDFVFRRKADVVLVGDAKWKVLRPNVGRPWPPGRRSVQGRRIYGSPPGQPRDDVLSKPSRILARRSRPPVSHRRLPGFAYRNRGGPRGSGQRSIRIARRRTRTDCVSRRLRHWNPPFCDGD